MCWIAEWVYSIGSTVRLHYISWIIHYILSVHGDYWFIYALSNHLTENNCTPSHVVQSAFQSVSTSASDSCSYLTQHTELTLGGCYPVCSTIPYQLSRLIHMESLGAHYSNHTTEGAFSKTKISFWYLLWTLTEAHDLGL